MDFRAEYVSFSVCLFACLFFNDAHVTLRKHNNLH